MTVRTAMVSVARSSSRPTSVASSGGTSESASRDVAPVPDSVSSGAGNHVSRIDPSEARVANPMPAAPVTLATLLARHTGPYHYPWWRAGLAEGPDRADRGAGRHPQRVGGRSTHRRRGGDRAARPDVRLRDHSQRQRRVGAYPPEPAVAGAVGRAPGHRPG